eukprot:Gb_32535 [translate_table: standard]
MEALAPKFCALVEPPMARPTDLVEYSKVSFKGIVGGYIGRSQCFAFVTMSIVEDAQATTEKMNGLGIGGRVIKLNVIEKPLDITGLKDQADDANFVGNPHKVYVGNLAKTIDIETPLNEVITRCIVKMPLQPRRG